MTSTPDGPYGVRERDDRLRCFDETAAATFRWICRLTATVDERVTVALLADVYVLLGARADDGSDLTDGVDVAAVAFELVADALGDVRGDAGLSVFDRALHDLAIEGHGDPADVARVIGRFDGEIADDIDLARQRVDAAGGSERVRAILHGYERWLDDDSLATARAAVADGRWTPPELAQSATWDASTWLHSTLAEPPLTERRWARAHAAASRPQTRRSRRLMVGTCVGVIAVVTAGFVWTAPSSSDGGSSTDGNLFRIDSSVPTTDRPPVSDTDPPTTTADSGATEGAVVDMPVVTDPYRGPTLHLTPGFIATGLAPEFFAAGLWENIADSGNSTQFQDTWFQLWAEPDASRTSGRWIAMATSKSVTDGGFVRSGQTRIAGDGFSGLRHVDDDGVISLALHLGSGFDRLAVSLEAFGVSEADLIRLATSLTHFDAPGPGGAQPVANATFEPSAAASDIMAGMELIETGATNCCGVNGLLGNRTDSRYLYYQSSAEPDARNISVWTEDGVSRQEFDRFVVQHSTDPAAPTNPSSTMQIGDRLVHVAGGVQDLGTRQVAYSSGWWTEQGQTVTVAGQMDISALITTIQSVRRATDDEWLQLNEDAYLAGAANGSTTVDDAMSGPLVHVGSIELDDSATWSLDFNQRATSSNLTLSTGSSSNGSSVYEQATDTLQPVNQYDSADATVLVVVLHSVDPADQIRVTVAGRETKLLPLVKVGDTDTFAALDAFQELPPCTVELLDAAGNLILPLAP